MHRRWLGVACLLVVLLGAGCASVFDTRPTETVTPAPVPAQEATATPGPTTTPTATPDRGLAAAQPRYLDLRPTCRRPPGLVIHIQVMALANDDVDPGEGINTTYRFTRGSSPARAAPPDRFVRNVRTDYTSLLDAQRVSYGPLRRNGSTAFRNVTVETETVRTTYNWTVEQQADGPAAGCWQTTVVTPVDFAVTVGEGEEVAG